MKHYLGCDAHKKYSVFVAIDESGKTSRPVRVDHQRDSYREFLRALPSGADIALETTGNWYWLVDEMEAAGLRPHLADAAQAKQLMGRPHKTDPLDAKALAILMRNGTLPEVWIPPRNLRDQRELLRTRMALRDLRSSLKHRIHAALDRYGSHVLAKDLFGVQGRAELDTLLLALPPETALMIRTQVEALDDLDNQVHGIEQRIAAVLEPTPMVQRLQTLPGVGVTLAPIIAFEIGDVARFPRAEQLASYAGLVPRVKSSGGHTRLGKTSRYVNLFLKWAFVEAANCAVKLKCYQHSHVKQLFLRLKHKGYGRAMVAVARHLAEAAFWVLTKDEDYRPPRARSTEGHATGGFVQQRVSARHV